MRSHLLRLHSLVVTRSGVSTRGLTGPAIGRLAVWSRVRSPSRSRLRVDDLCFPRSRRLWDSAGARSCCCRWLLCSFHVLFSALFKLFLSLFESVDSGLQIWGLFTYIYCSCTYIYLLAAGITKAGCCMAPPARGVFSPCCLLLRARSRCVDSL